MIDRIHHVGVVVRDADAALGFYRDVMGLEVSVDRIVEEQGVRGVLLGLGENEIELLEPVDNDTGVARFLESRGETLHHICFSTDDIRDELDRLMALNIELIDEEPREGLAGQVAFIHPSSMHGVLIELAQPPTDAPVSMEKGFDHLAVTVENLEVASVAWNDVVGLSVESEFTPPGRAIVIGKMPCGQSIIELLAPVGYDPPMLIRLAEQGERAMSMIAIEVDDIDSEVARYRESGIEIPDATTGVLPNSVTTSISGDQAFGLTIQLISFSQ